MLAADPASPVAALLLAEAVARALRSRLQQVWRDELTLRAGDDHVALAKVIRVVMDAARFAFSPQPAAQALAARVIARAFTEGGRGRCRGTGTEVDDADVHTENLISLLFPKFGECLDESERAVCAHAAVPAKSTAADSLAPVRASQLPLRQLHGRFSVRLCIEVRASFGRLVCPGSRECKCPQRLSSLAGITVSEASVAALSSDARNVSMEITVLEPVVKLMQASAARAPRQSAQQWRR